MSHSQQNEVRISIPLSEIVRSIDQLPTEALSQLLQAVETALAKRADLKGAGEGIPVEDMQFWESELGQYILAEADENIAIEDVRQALSVIPGSLAMEISRERDEVWL